MKSLPGIMAAALMLTGIGCVRMEDGALLTLPEARQEGVANLLDVQCDEWHSELAREFRTNRRFHALGREITFAGLEQGSHRAGEDLELALALMQELLLERDDAAARRMLRERRLEYLECQLESAGVELLALEREFAVWEDVPDHPRAGSRMAEIRAAMAEKNLLYRTMLGRDAGSTVLLLTEDDPALPPLPPPRADLATALRCRPEFAGCGVDAETLAAAAEELYGKLPPREGIAAALATGRMLLLLPRQLTRRKLEGKPVPEHVRVLCSALGVMQQLILDREAYDNARHALESLVPDETDPVVRAEKIAAEYRLHQKILELRRDLGLQPGEPLAEDQDTKREWHNAAGEIALTAEILTELMQELE